LKKRSIKPKGKLGLQRDTWLKGILRMKGMGKDLWRGEDPDEYVRNLRKNWK